MANVDLSEEIDKIKLEKEKLKIKEKILREKEKRKQAKRLERLAKLIAKANIDNLDENVLFGAFLEVSENAKNQDKVESWKIKCQSFQGFINESSSPAISVSFSQNPHKEEKEKLKNLGFRWNSFRKEFYGYAKKQEIENLLPNSKIKIETLD